jgi:hypothetical protein
MEHQLYLFAVLQAKGPVMAQDVVALSLSQSMLTKILKMEKQKLRKYKVPTEMKFLLLTFIRRKGEEGERGVGSR